MRKVAIVGALVVAVALPPPPAAAQRPPAVNKAEAKLLMARALHKNASWRHKRWGWIDCNGGRVNRTHWRCKFRWQTPRYFSWCGKGMVSGAWFNPNEGNRPWFETRWGAVPCYYGY